MKEEWRGVEIIHDPRNNHTRSVLDAGGLRPAVAALENFFMVGCLWYFFLAILKTSVSRFN